MYSSPLVVGQFRLYRRGLDWVVSILVSCRDLRVVCPGTSFGLLSTNPSVTFGQGEKGRELNLGTYRGVHLS